MKKFLILLIFLVIVAPISFACSNIDVSYKDGIYHIKLNGRNVIKKIKFVSSDILITNRDAHLKTGSRLTVNAGYFDPKNQKTISYIRTDRNTSEDPMFNENLLSNPLLRINIDKMCKNIIFQSYLNLIS